MRAFFLFIVTFISMDNVFAAQDVLKKNNYEYSIKNLLDKMDHVKKKHGPNNNIAQIIDHSVNDVIKDSNNSTKHSSEEFVLKNQIEYRKNLFNNESSLPTHQEIINQEHELLWHRTFEDHIKGMIYKDTKISPKNLIDKVLPSFKKKFDL